MDNLSQYINEKFSKNRIQLLADAKKSKASLPIPLVDDLLCLNLPLLEQIALIDLIDSEDNLALEQFLLQGLSKWQQDLSAFALRKWSQCTDHLLWFRLLKFSSEPMASQRVQYTILDQCSQYGSKNLVSVFQDLKDLKELSPAFHSLLFHRSLERGLSHPHLDELALYCVEELKRSPHPENKTLVSAISWLNRHNLKALEELSVDPSVPQLWRDQLLYAVNHTNTMKQTESAIKKVLSSTPKKDLSKLRSVWPPLSLRNLIHADLLKESIEFVWDCIPDDSQMGEVWNFFSGVEPKTLISILPKINDELIFAKTINVLSPLLESPLNKKTFDLVIERLAGSKNPELFLNSLNLRLRLTLTQANSKTPGKFDKLFKEEQNTIDSFDPKKKKKTKISTTDYVALNADSEKISSEIRERRVFFDTVYRNRDTKIAKAENFWEELTIAWQKPNESQLAKLSTEARKQPELFKLCYIETLGRFQGCDTAALKLLDFIRSTEESIMLSVINALSGIGTPRALQELTSAITRPNTTPFLKLEICNLLQNFDLTKLQSELRSAIEDFNAHPELSEETQEIIEAISNLLTPTSQISVESTASTGNDTTKSSKPDFNLDVKLKKKIPNYTSLSSEVKRALRTAQFFHDQIKDTDAINLIDLSPVIDMQYKALELLFRESFEEMTFSLINNGVLQRKLDVIGYARPIPKTMDQFENYISSLPIIDTIPYFSKFKLRKMLRAICQYRPGKRFTLDGIKAFSLFFVCFGRKTCQYQLSQIIELGFKSDEKLFEFGKTLHIFQDFRNRAAHEGFHPEAHNDIDGIWRSTVEIIQTVFTIKSSLKIPSAAEATTGHYGASKSNPIIEHKKPKKVS